MTPRLYPAAIVKGDDAGFGVVFVDLPGCVSEGDTFEQAVAMGHEALALALETMAAHGDAIPEPTPYAQAVRKLDPRLRRDLVAVQMIPGAASGKAVKISVTIDETLLQRIDAAAGPYGRSAFLADGAREKLAAGAKPASSGLAGIGSAGLAERAAPFRHQPVKAPRSSRKRRA